MKECIRLDSWTFSPQDESEALDGVFISFFAHVEAYDLLTFRDAVGFPDIVLIVEQSDFSDLNIMLVDKSYWPKAIIIQFLRHAYFSYDSTGINSLDFKLEISNWLSICNVVFLENWTLKITCES